MQELTRVRCFELTKSSRDEFPVSVDFSDVLSAYSVGASITAVSAVVDPASCPVTHVSLVKGFMVDPANKQRVRVGLGGGASGYLYKITLTVTTDIEMPGSVDFAKFSAVLLVSVKDL